MERNKITAEQVRALLDYSIITGKLYWKSTGKIAGSIRPDRSGIDVGLLTHKYRAHRIVWLWVTGSWPEAVIDHKNGNGLYNAWINLRDVSQLVNLYNQHTPHSKNKHGYFGVTRNNKRWSSCITLADGKRKHLGTFDTPEQAEAAYLRAKAVRDRAHEGTQKVTTP